MNSHYPFQRNSSWITIKFQKIKHIDESSCNEDDFTSHVSIILTKSSYALWFAPFFRREWIKIVNCSPESIFIKKYSSEIFTWINVHWNYSLESIAFHEFSTRTIGNIVIFVGSHIWYFGGRMISDYLCTKTTKVISQKFRFLRKGKHSSIPHKNRVIN